MHCSLLRSPLRVATLPYEEMPSSIRLVGFKLTGETSYCEHTNVSRHLQTAVSSCPYFSLTPQQRWQQHVPTMQKGNAQRALPLSSAKPRVVAPPQIKTTMRAEHYRLLLTMSMWAASWPLPLLPQHRSNVQEIKCSSSRQAFSLSSPCFTLQRSANIKFWGGVTISVGTDACLQDNSKL